MPQTFTNAALGYTTIVADFTQEVFEKFVDAYDKHRQPKEAGKMPLRSSLLKAALESGWVTTEPMLTPDEVYGLKPALVTWLVQGRGRSSLLDIYLEATTVPND